MGEGGGGAATVARGRHARCFLSRLGVMMENVAAPDSPAPAGSLARRVAVALVLGWVGLLVLPPFGLWTLRDHWLAELDAPAVQEQWDRFRQDMQQQSDRSGPVQHKVPKSVEPPLRVWLRDYFWLAVAAWAVLGTTLYAFLAVAVLGVVRAAQQ